MKKTLCFILAAAMLLALAGCGAAGGDSRYGSDAGLRRSAHADAHRGSDGC